MTVVVAGVITERYEAHRACDMGCAVNFCE